MPTLNKLLRQLRELAPALNKATDDATRVIADIENLFSKELALRIDARVNICCTSLTETKTEYTRLEYRRVAGKFRIAVVVAQGNEFVNDRGSPDTAWTEVSATPWAECPRDVKLAAFASLPALLEAMAIKAEETAERVTGAYSAVKKLIGEIRSSEPSTEQIAEWPDQAQMALVARCAPVALQLLGKHYPSAAVEFKNAVELVQQYHAGTDTEKRARKVMKIIAQQSGNKFAHGRAPGVGPHRDNRAEEVYAAATTAIVAALQATIDLGKDDAWNVYESTLSAARAAHDPQAGGAVMKAVDDILEEFKPSTDGDCH